MSAGLTGSADHYRMIRKAKTWVYEWVPLFFVLGLGLAALYAIGPN